MPFSSLASAKALTFIRTTSSSVFYYKLCLYSGLSQYYVQSMPFILKRESFYLTSSMLVIPNWLFSMCSLSNIAIQDLYDSPTTTSPAPSRTTTFLTKVIITLFQHNALSSSILFFLVYVHSSSSSVKHLHTLFRLHILSLFTYLFNITSIYKSRMIKICSETLLLIN